jgi:predicted RNA-binding protein with PUA-like domain
MYHKKNPEVDIILPSLKIKPVNSTSIVKIVKEAFFDKTDKTQKFVSVIVKSVSPLKREVSLQEIKKNKDFKDFSLVKQSRLSVMEVDLIYWKKICKMGRV